MRGLSRKGGREGMEERRRGVEEKGDEEWKKRNGKREGKRRNRIRAGWMVRGRKGAGGRK